ncbi:MAG: hypothetical protein IKB96_00480 [Prevotella sp.]|nr:hypothetical protein [Prevotella sp.]
MLLIDNAERVAQQIKIQLLTFYGEWYLDTTWGVPYMEYILVKNPNFTIIRQIFREQILSVDDVESVESLDVEYDAQTRTMTLVYSATTSYGLITRKEVLGYGIR